jgi:hypothetical protein
MNKTNDFTVLGHKLEIYGYCRDCNNLIDRDCNNHTLEKEKEKP